MAWGKNIGRKYSRKRMAGCVWECVKSVVLVNYSEDPGKGLLYEVITYEKVGIFLSVKVSNWKTLSIGVV